MGACTVITTLTSLMYTNVRIPACNTLVGATLSECLELCRSNRSCQSYFHQGSANNCCPRTSRLQGNELDQQQGIDYYWLYPNECHPDTGYALDRYADLCYRVYTGSMTWDSAKMACEAEGASLIQLNTLKKITTIRDLVSTNANYATVAFSIGLMYNVTSVRWEWPDGSKLDTRDFDTNYPLRNPQMIRVIMEPTVGHKWRNILATDTAGHICERPFLSLDPYV